MFLCLWRQHPFLHKTKGPTRNPISPTPSPPSAGVHVNPPPPPRRAIFRLPCLTPVLPHGVRRRAYPDRPHHECEAEPHPRADVGVVEEVHGDVGLHGGVHRELVPFLQQGQQRGRGCRWMMYISEHCEGDSNKGRRHTRTHTHTRARAPARTHARTCAHVHARMHTRRGIRSQSKHCCGADGAAGRWGVLVNAVKWIQIKGVTHARARTHVHVCTCAHRHTHARAHNHARAHTCTRARAHVHTPWDPLAIQTLLRCGRSCMQHSAMPAAMQGRPCPGRHTCLGMGGRPCVTCQSGKRKPLRDNRCRVRRQLQREKSSGAANRPPPPPPPRDVSEGGEGLGGWFGTQQFVYQQWPDKIHPNAAFRYFPRWSLWSGGKGGGG